MCNQITSLILNFVSSEISISFLSVYLYFLLKILATTGSRTCEIVQNIWASRVVVAQLVKQLLPTQEIRSSNPVISKLYIT